MMIILIYANNGEKHFYVDKVDGPCTDMYRQQSSVMSTGEGWREKNLACKGERPVLLNEIKGELLG